jgi:hypothetical protein
VVAIDNSNYDILDNGLQSEPDLTYSQNKLG